VNIEHLRKTLKAQWLTYYRENRDWLTRLGVWVTCEGERRPSSSFILGTLSILEPQLIQLLPLIVDLSSNPDRIVIALGLNFNPDEELETFEGLEPPVENGHMNSMRMLPEGSHTVDVAAQPMLRREPYAEVEPVEASPPSATVHPTAQSVQEQKTSDRGIAKREMPERGTYVNSEPPAPIAPQTPHPPTQLQEAQSPQIPSPPTQPTLSKPTASKPTASKPTDPQPSATQEETLADRPVQAVTSSPSVFEKRFPVVRPVMDSVELSAGELPNREVEEPNGKNQDERTSHSAR
jgi:hypothetical protein